MKNTPWLRSLLQQDQINFLLTNRIPRITLTHAMGWYSSIRSPWLTALSIRIWKWFSPDLNLAESPARAYPSLQSCFTRELLPGLRPVDHDPGILCSPSDGIVGACGPIAGTEVFQAKGFPYRLDELFTSGEPPEPYRDGVYVTLRLTAGMYHRFHAPAACDVEQVTYISGDTWNVNPVALSRVQKLFCLNERALIRLRLHQGGWPVMLVPVAAILVASIRLHFADVRLHLRYRGPNVIQKQARMDKGQEMGWFEHGSTILLFAPKGFRLAPGIEAGCRIKVGQALLSLPDSKPKASD